MPQAYRFAVLPEEAYCAFQPCGLGALSACVPEAAPVDSRERLGGAGAIPHDERAAVAERCQGIDGRLVVADQQLFQLFPLHAAAPVGMLLYRRRVQRPQQPSLFGSVLQK